MGCQGTTTSCPWSHDDQGQFIPKEGLKVFRPIRRIGIEDIRELRNDGTVGFGLDSRDPKVAIVFAACRWGEIPLREPRGLSHETQLVAMPSQDQARPHSLPQELEQPLQVVELPVSDRHGESQRFGTLPFIEGMHHYKP